MSFSDNFSSLSCFSTNWLRLLIRGVLMLVIGVSLVVLTLFKPDVMLFHARDFSWLPLCGFVVLAVGWLECLDALFIKDVKDFFLKLQNGFLDVVVAGLIVFSTGDDPARLSLLIAAFLMIKGLFRITISYAIASATVISTRIGACVSIVLGLLIWMQWPSSAAWFLAFCLSVEIALRGWAVIMLSLWLRVEKKKAV